MEKIYHVISEYNILSVFDQTEERNIVIQWTCEDKIIEIELRPEDLARLFWYSGPFIFQPRKPVIDKQIKESL